MEKSTATLILTVFYIIGLCAFQSEFKICFALFVTLFLAAACLANKIKPAFCILFSFAFFLGFYNANFHYKKSDALSSIPRANNVKIAGRVDSIPVNINNKGKVFLRVYRAEVFDYDLKPSNTRILVASQNGCLKGFKIGDIVEFEGRLRQPAPPSNRSEFDYKNYLLNKGVFNILYIKETDFKILAHPNIQTAKSKPKEVWWTALQKMDILRDKIISKHGKFLKSPRLEVYGGIVFGDNAINPPDEIKQSFINSGLLHLLAASGLNVALIFGIWQALCLFLKFPYRANLISGMGIIILYTFMTGFPPSILRASIMLLLVLFGKLIFRNTNDFVLIFFTGFCMLLVNPQLLNDVGFELSFLVTGGLITCIEPICSKFKKTDKKFKSKFSKAPKLLRIIIYSVSPAVVAGVIFVPLVAQIWAAPLQMYYFNTFSTMSIFANIAVVPFIGLASFTGFLSSILALFPVIGDQAVKTAALILNPLIAIILAISNFFAEIPCSIIKTPSPDIFQIILYYAIVCSFIFCLKNDFKTIKQNAIFLFLIFTLLCTFIRFKNDNFEITVFDVGNADAFLIKTPKDKHILIDTGRIPYNGVSSAKRVILEYLYDQNIREVEKLIVTHFDSDHSGGTIDLIDNIKIKTIMVQENPHNTENSFKISEKIKEKKISSQIAKNDEKIYEEENFEIRTFKANIKKGKDFDRHENENSIVTLIKFKDTAALFMGDVGVEGFKEIKEDLRKRLPERGIDILKIGHHGAKGVVEEKMLEFLKPKHSIVSTGFNPYGHPSLETIKLLENSGSKIYSTEDLGEIEFSINKAGKIKIWSMF